MADDPFTLLVTLNKNVILKSSNFGCTSLEYSLMAINKNVYYYIYKVSKISNFLRLNYYIIKNKKLWSTTINTILEKKIN